MQPFVETLHDNNINSIVYVSITGDRERFYKVTGELKKKCRKHTFMF